MNIFIAISAALLPAILPWLYIWKKDPQPELTSRLVKAVVWGMAICVPVAAHGVYDALALSGLVNPYIGGLSFFILIWFCVKMHKVAKTKVLALIEKDNFSINIS